MSEKMPDSQGEGLLLQPATTREELAALLTRAFDLEHGLACIYLFVASSLKNDVGEGGLTDAQAASTRSWRRQLAAAGMNRMLRVTQLANVLTAIGETPRITRPPFAKPGSADAARTGLALEPFSPSTLASLARYERWEAPFTLSAQSEERDEGTNEHREPGPTNSTTNGDLYAALALSFQRLSPEEIFLCPAESQVTVNILALDRQPIAVTDRSSAQAALALITGQADEGEHTGVCETILAEYTAAVADAQQEGASFEPARPVGANPRTHLHSPTPGNTPLVETWTVAAADLFNGAYDTMLLILLYLFTHADETAPNLDQLARAILRLLDSVIRPLGEALTHMPADRAALPGRCAGPPFGDSGTVPELVHHAAAWALLEERLWKLATAATTVRLNPELPPEIQEATAALQDLACQFAPADGPRGLDAKLAELKQLEATLNCGIQCLLNGPYLVTNVETLTNWLGERLPTRPQMALCRCGGSATKPFCDGTHARLDFTTQKDPKRVPNHRTTLVGTAVTILDNRGICAHSGFCTDRLSSVFHAGQEPFVSPNGARMDDIIRAVRSCPSGALSYALNGVEARDQVDQVRPPAIEISKDGPYRMTGSIPLKDEHGNIEPSNEGASREHYSLCRCGHSQNKPLCSGMHWYVNFHDPVPDPMHDPTLFEWVGGLPALLRMTHLFYDKYIPEEPLLRPLFAHMSPDHPERVAAWLGEVFGGPKNYSEQYGAYVRMLSQHIGKGIKEEQRARWVSLLCQAADEAGVAADAEFRSAFMSYIEWGSRLAVENSTPGAHPPPHMPMPRWNWGTAGLPSSRVSALAPVVEEKPVALPKADEPLHFTQHIKPLFRTMDRQSMMFAFDLWEYKDAVAHADGILQCLQNGSMPCDGAWPPEKVAIFQRWVESGTPE